MIERLQSNHFYRYLVVSMLFHLLLLGLALTVFLTPPDSMAKVTDHQMISLGLQAAMAGAIQSPAVEQVEPPVPEPVKRLQKEEVKKEPEPVRKKKRPVREKKTVKEPEPEKTTKEPEVISPVLKQVKKQQKEPEEKKENQKIPQIVSPEMKQGAQGVNGAQEQAPRVVATGLDHQTGGANQESFDLLIREHLLANKVTPKLLRHKRQRGEVTIEFVIDRNGALQNYKTVRASRIREFDRAAIKLVRNAAPFPEAPDYISWEQKRYVIVLNYETR